MASPYPEDDAPTPAARDRYWQERWASADIYTWQNDATRPKFYALEMFPYTSGKLHMGHARNYSMGDAVARMQRARGFDVLYPMGWDAFGLPAETAAQRSGQDPAAFTQQSIDSMKRAMQALGLSYSWANEVSTCAPDYIAAQQRLFIEFFAAGLIYRDTSYVFWCETHQTVLAAEQAAGGVCWRCGNPVIKKRTPQWFFDIRSYADRLLAGLDTLDGWPSNIVDIQRQWIGRSEGAEIRFDLPGADTGITVFTTRPDTLTGCTFLALAPEHPLLDRLPSLGDAVTAYRHAALLQTVQERAKSGKTGVALGLVATNPWTGEQVPIYVADYVLSSYGTGAVMGVPAHDQRDFEFAQAHGLPIRRIFFDPAGGGASDDVLTEAAPDRGIMIGSGELDGLSSDAAAQAVVDRLVAAGSGRTATSFRLQNWSVSRQRRWGNPIPIVHCAKCGAVPARASDLPILPPRHIVPEGEGETPVRDTAAFETDCPACGGAAFRDPDTMDTFVDSSWYFMRFVDPAGERPIDRALVDRMLPVDVYIGGIEHATLHLIYARFMTMVLHDLGHCSITEPFLRVYNQGMVNDELGRKQSKSLGNIVEPSAIAREHGADVLRVFLLFKTAPNAAINWNDAELAATTRYLERVTRLPERYGGALLQHPDALDASIDDVADDAQRALCATVHDTIRRVTEDIGEFRFNTAIAALMELTNDLYRYAPETGAAADDRFAAGAVRTLIRLLHPFAPHRTEDMWLAATPGAGLLATTTWPVMDARALASDLVTIAMQVNGRTVGQFSHLEADRESDLVALAAASERVKRRLEGRPIKRYIHVPGRILNFVA